MYDCGPARLLPPCHSRQPREYKRTPAPGLPASSLYNSFFPCSLAYPLVCMGTAYALRTLILLIARLAALGRREGPAEADMVVSSIAAGPEGGRTSGVRARKVMARVTEPNIVIDYMVW